MRFSMQNNREKILKILSPIIALVAFLLVWFVLAIVVGVELLLPSPTSVFNGLITLLAGGEQGRFYLAVISTLGRALVGFVISLLLACVFTVISLVSDIARRAIEPLIVIARATPTMSIILLALVWLNSNLSPVLVGVLISFPALYSALIGGINSVDPDLIEMCKVYKVGLRRRITSLYVPCVVPSFSEQCASVASLNLKVVIAGEVLAQTSISMGLEMQLTKVMLDTPMLFAWTVVAILVSFVLEIVIKRLFRLLPGGRV